MKRVVYSSLSLSAIVFFLVQCNVIWTSPKSYTLKRDMAPQPTIMSLDTYVATGLIDTHARPYIYTITNKKNSGAVLVFGAEHTNDPEDKQFLAMKENWEMFNPTIALVEGKLGFLFSWVQNPIKNLGEGGLIAKLAKSEDVQLFSWEPGRAAEVDLLLDKYDRIHTAAFFCFRPYLNKYPDLPKTEQDDMMKNLIAERTKRPGIVGAITSVEQLDSLWKADFPELANWRTYQHPRNGWPEGKFKQMAEETNLLRDVYMCNAILELVNSGERVFISMGSSHAPRIERTLREGLE